MTTAVAATADASLSAAVVLCHDWLTTFGGSDQVASRLAETLRISRIFTYVAWEETVAQLFADRQVTSIGPRGGLAQRRWQWLLPHMPFAWRGLDLSSFDLVVTSSHAAVNAVRPRDDAVLVSYCHTPMRYAWEWRAESRRFPVLLRPLVPAIAASLRAGDRRWSQRVDLFLANSRFVAGRIATSYRKPSLVVYPPIDTDYWTPGHRLDKGGFFLVSGRLVGYKRPEVVVAAAEEAGVRVVIAGDGPMLPLLRKMAGSSVDFVVSPSRAQLRDLYRSARAYVFAGVEDFGMSIVEAQACGTPVIALGAGGALETVEHGRTGALVKDASSRTFAAALLRFRPDDYDPEVVRERALRFDRSRFDEKVSWAVARAVERDWATLMAHPSWVSVGGRA